MKGQRHSLCTNGTAPSQRLFGMKGQHPALKNNTAGAGPSKDSMETGQATTELVLLFPLFMLFLFAFVKIFTLLVLVQKMEIASYYAGRRWNLESHRNVKYEGNDGALMVDIQKKTEDYLGMNTDSIRKFLDLQDVKLNIQRTQVWSVVTLEVDTRPWSMPAWTGLKFRGFQWEVVKYVPQRDRPIPFRLPGIQDQEAANTPAVPTGE